MHRPLKVLGLDPSLSNLGIAFGTVHPVGQIQILDIELVQTAPTKHKGTRKNLDDLYRSRVLASALRKAVDKYGPDVVMVEVPHGSQSARAMASYGVCLGLLASLTVPMIEVSAEDVKMTAVGKKTATKDEMIQWAMALPDNNGVWTLSAAKNEHMADAIGAIHAGVAAPNFQLMTALL